MSSPYQPVRIQAHIAVESADSVRVEPSYLHPEDEAITIPWYVRIGSNGALQVYGRATLADLRDALTAALDAHPEAM